MTRNPAANALALILYNIQVIQKASNDYVRFDADNDFIGAQEAARYQLDAHNNVLDAVELLAKINNNSIKEILAMRDRLLSDQEAVDAAAGIIRAQADL